MEQPAAILTDHSRFQVEQQDTMVTKKKAPTIDVLWKRYNAMVAKCQSVTTSDLWSLVKDRERELGFDPYAGHMRTYSFDEAERIAAQNERLERERRRRQGALDLLEAWGGPAERLSSKREADTLRAM